MTAIDVAAATAKLQSRIVITESDCWEWQGTRRLGYGQIWLNGRLWSAHRVAAHIWLGLDLAERWTLACHHCDNPPCVNPDHLFIGTQLANNLDKIAKGRANYPSGSRLPIEQQIKSCVVCGSQYKPGVKHRTRSKVCSATCLVELRRRFGQGRGTKLTAEKVRAIRAGLAAGIPPKVLAADVGVSRPTITNVKLGKTWGHVA